MDILYKILLDPFVQMGTAPDLFVQTLWEGMVGGMLYALIALGFVLIFKASGVFNFAQGIMVVFRRPHAGWPATTPESPHFWHLALTIAVMFALAFAGRANSFAAADQSARYHSVHGDIRTDLLPDRLR